MPAICMMIYMVWYLGTVFKMFSYDDPFYIYRVLTDQLPRYFILMLVSTGCIVSVLAYLVRHVFANDHLTDTMKTVWTILFFVFQLIPMIVYMIMYIYSKPWQTLFKVIASEKRRKKIVTGIVTFLPLVLLFIFITMIFDVMTNMMPNMLYAVNEEAMVQEMLAYMMQIFLWEGMYFLMIFGVFIFYVVEVIRNYPGTGGYKGLWIGLMFFFNIIAMMVYWVVYILFEPNKDQMRLTEEEPIA